MKEIVERLETSNQENFSIESKYLYLKTFPGHFFLWF